MSSSPQELASTAARGSGGAASAAGACHHAAHAWPAASRYSGCGKLIARLPPRRPPVRPVAGHESATAWLPDDSTKKGEPRTGPPGKREAWLKLDTDQARLGMHARLAGG